MKEADTSMTAQVNPPTAPCPACGFRIFWRDNQVGKVHCADCFEPASAVIVDQWFHVEAVALVDEPDLFGAVDLFADSPADSHPTYRAQEIDFPIAIDHPQVKRTRESDDDGGVAGGVPDDAYNESLDQAIMWFIEKRLSGELANAMGAITKRNESITEDDPRPPTPKKAIEFYLLRNGRIIEGSRAQKSKGVIAITWIGACRWYRVKPRDGTEQPAAGYQSNMARS